MKQPHAIARRLTRALLIPLTLILTFRVWAQQPEVEIRDLDFDKILSPFYPGQSHRRANVTREEWFQLSLEYRVGGYRTWLDEVELEWHVLLESPDRKVLMSKTITYADVPDGRHYAVVYLRPNFVKHYGDRERVDKRDLRVLAIVRVNGKEVDRYHYPTRQPVGNWWEPGRLPTGTIVKDRELLARTETPFAPLDWDFYQDIKALSPPFCQEQRKNETGK